MLQVTLSSEAVVLGRRVFEVELGRRTAVVGIVEEPGPLCLPLTQPPVSSFLSPFLLTQLELSQLSLHLTALFLHFEFILTVSVHRVDQIITELFVGL